MSWSDSDLTLGSNVLEAFVLGAVLASGPSQQDVRSIPVSSYRESEYYMPKKEEYRRCIIWRESRNNYRAHGPGGSGAYSFIRSTWKHYAELAGFDYWATQWPHLAPKYVQDAVFWRTWNHGKGKFHWSTKWNPGIPSCFPE